MGGSGKKTLGSSQASKAMRSDPTQGSFGKRMKYLRRGQEAVEEVEAEVFFSGRSYIDKQGQRVYTTGQIPP